MNRYEMVDWKYTMNATTTVLISLLAIAVVMNLVLLNYTTFRLLPTRLNTIESSTKSTSTPEIKEDSCGDACQQALQSALKQVDQKIATLAGKTGTILPAKAAPTIPPTTKESFIPLGVGSTTKSDWEDVAGSDVFINSENFPNVQNSYFEVSMHIPTKNGAISARLYNVTDKHPVWFSDVSTDQDISTFRSAKFQLDSGNKQYRIQLKTSLQYESILDTARIKIISQ